MAFKDWTRLFRRSETQLHPVDSDAAAGDATAPTRHDSEENRDQASSRTALMKELEQGFHQVGRVVDRFDEHLGTTNRLMESVAAEQERLPALITELTAAASASRHANEAMATQLSQRDEANQRLLTHLASLSDSFELERDQHRTQLALVLRLQRGSRRVLMFMLFLSFLLISLLLALVLLLALRPDLIGSPHLTAPFPSQLPAAVPAAQASAAPAVDPTIQDGLRAAAESDQPVVQDTARQIQDSQP